MREMRLHRRLVRPDVTVDSPLLECHLLNLSTAGLAIETSTGLRLGVPYPFRLHHGDHSISTEAEVRWCRFVGNATTETGDWRPVYRAGAAFVEWLAPEEVEPASAFEHHVDSALDAWMQRSRAVAQSRPTKRTIVRHAPRRRRS